jgi:archaeosine-15-forming tRNA-guanine transglycosylase
MFRKGLLIPLQKYIITLRGHLRPNEFGAMIVQTEDTLLPVNHFNLTGTTVGEAFRDFFGPLLYLSEGGETLAV